MTDKYRIDSHKLIFHVDRVNRWLNGENIYPVYAEISPSGACNHRCVYCALDFMEYKPRFLDTAMLKTRLEEMGRLGLKSIMFAGEGEPFLHPDMTGITAHAAACGIDTAFTTNAAVMTPQKAEQVLPHTAWIKASVNAATPATYAKVHGTRPEDFEKAVAHMTHAAKVRKEKGYKCALGMQMVLLPDNANEAVLLAETAKKAGMDYLVIKPYSQHPQSNTNEYKDVNYAAYEKLGAELERFNGNGFSVIFRSDTMRTWDAREKSYRRCQALPFWTYIDAGGNVWGCSMFLGREEFLYGDINKLTFREIWEGEKRRKSLEFVCGMDVNACRINCRMDKINSYLWELKNPPEHVNFI